MAESEIGNLPEQTGAASGDQIAIVDKSADVTKFITFSNFEGAISLAKLSSNSLSDLSDVGSTSATDGHVIASDGTDFDSESISSVTESHVNLSDLKDVDTTVSNSQLTNSSVTVAGNSVSLGGSIAVSVNDLSDVSSSTESAGQVPIWNATSTQYENSTLTGGNNISITNADASITIASDISNLADLDDVGTTSATDGHVIASDGTDFDSEGIASVTEAHVNLSDLKDVDTTVSNSQLTNSSVTVAGNSVSLGGSTSVSFNDLSDVASSTESAGEVPIWDATDTQYENSTLTGGNAISVTNADASITLAVGTDTIQTDEIDLSISPTWTGTHDYTGANLDLPTATDPTPTTEGRITWDTDDDSIKVGNGSGTTTIGGGGASSLSDLSDANVSSPTAGQTLIYHATNSQFENADITAGTGISSTTGDASITLSADEANIDHDSLQNFVANEHVDHSTVSISSGDGLSGGGDITASRTLNVDINGTTDLASPAVGDEILLSDTSNSNAIRKSDLDAILALYDDKTATLTNKTFDANGTGNSLSNVETADLASGAKTGSDTQVVTGTAGSDTDLGQWNANGDMVSVSIGDGLEESSGNLKTEEMYSFTAGMRQFATGLSNEEIERIQLQTGETFVVDRIEMRQKGGGSSASASVRVQDSTAATTIGSQDLGGTTKNPGSSGTANLVLIEVSNSTGSSINASVTVTGRIQGA